MKSLSIILIISMLFSCSQKRIEEKKTTKIETIAVPDVLNLSIEQVKSLALSYADVSSENISATLRLSGKLAVLPDQRTTLSSVVGGHIKSIQALPGKIVKKGQQILSLEDPSIIQLQQDYLIAKAELLSVEPNYLRQKELNTSKTTSDKNLQQAESAYYALLATKKGLEERLRMLGINTSTISISNIQRAVSIVAPFDGVITQVMVNNGKYVNASDELVEIINPKGYVITFNVFEKDISDIQVGQNIAVYTNGQANQKMIARVMTKVPVVSEDGDAQIMAEFVGTPSVQLAEGLFLNGEVQLANVRAYVLPMDAIVSFAEKEYVFEQITPTQFKLIEVQIGTQQNDNIQVLNYEVIVNKKIIQNGAYGLLMAMKNAAEE